MILLWRQSAWSLFVWQRTNNVSVSWTIGPVCLSTDSVVARMLLSGVWRLTTGTRIVNMTMAFFIRSGLKTGGSLNDGPALGTSLLLQRKSQRWFVSRTFFQPRLIGMKNQKNLHTELVFSAELHRRSQGRRTHNTESEIQLGSDRCSNTWRSTGQKLIIVRLLSFVFTHLCFLLLCVINICASAAEWQWEGRSCCDLFPERYTKSLQRAQTAVGRQRRWMRVTMTTKSSSLCRPGDMMRGGRTTEYKHMKRSWKVIKQTFCDTASIKFVLSLMSAETLTQKAADSAYSPRDLDLVPAHPETYQSLQSSWLVLLIWLHLTRFQIRTWTQMVRTRIQRHD